MIQTRLVGSVVNNRSKVPRQPGEDLLIAAARNQRELILAIERGQRAHQVLDIRPDAEIPRAAGIDGDAHQPRIAAGACRRQPYRGNRPASASTLRRTAAMVSSDVIWCRTSEISPATSRIS